MNAIPVADEDSDDLPLVRVRCYARRALHWRLDVAPLCAAYAAAFGAYALRPELEEVAVVGTPCLVLAHLLLFLATHWSVRVRCATQLYACPPARASLVCAEPASGAPRLCPLEREAAAPDAFFFTYHKRKYLLGAAGKGGGSPSCRKLRMPSSEPLSHYAECAGLQTPAAVEAARARYGSNDFSIPRPAFSELLQEHATAPFFVFQMLCVLLWRPRLLALRGRAQRLSTPTGLCTACGVGASTTTGTTRSSRC